MVSEIRNTRCCGVLMVLVGSSQKGSGVTINQWNFSTNCLLWNVNLNVADGVIAYRLYTGPTICNSTGYIVRVYVRKSKRGHWVTSIHMLVGG